jgi:hypothetical protein
LIVCLASASGEPQLTGAGTADGAFLLGRFFAAHERDIAVEKGNQLSIPELGMHNVVFVGPVAGNRNVQRMLAGLDLVLESKGIRNLKPQVGEDSFFADRLVEEAGLEEDYALIAHAPGLNGEGDDLYLSGNQTGSVAGAVRTFTDLAWGRVLISGLESRSGSLPRYFQAIVKVRSMDGTPVDVSYVMHHAIPPTK